MADTVSIPADTARAFTEAWCDGTFMDDIAVTLGCTEVDALAGLLRACGAEQAADDWIDAHAQDDDPNDRHYQGTVPADVSLAADGMRWSAATADIQEDR
ncbi:hypothetical protein [Streptomyces griseiscabiei]|uniref:Uncharacterized protein n=1 Tax=Streptomyces griseiscabiei TaxID=2993540 RepID=A0ABU4LKX7_9ACTN|nr:hypothetical protein [Streptomyces griseiscabiei]MDX2916243.1 hypothetical protein [Streptomyces griseiscabiei]